MTLDLANFERKTSEAVQQFWVTRAQAITQQQESGVLDQGGRAGVTGGKNMDGFVKLIADLVHANGLVTAEVHLTRRLTTIPGFFRPTKNWDIVVMHNHRLVAAIELKSQVGPSFGNNFNNRAEEAIGSAVDVATAYREGAFGDQPIPFLGWFLHLEDHEKSRAPVGVVEPHFSVMDGMRNLSYIDRYAVLCERLMSEKLYSAAAIVCSTREEGPLGQCWSPTGRASLHRFVAAFSAHIAEEVALSEDRDLS